MKRFVLATIAVAISTPASAWQDTAVLPTDRPEPTHLLGRTGRGNDS
jgi:hypothetical protein